MKCLHMKQAMRFAEQLWKKPQPANEILAVYDMLQKKNCYSKHLQKIGHRKELRALLCL